MEIEVEMLRYLATKFINDADRLETLMRKQIVKEDKAMLRPTTKKAATKKTVAKKPATTAKTAPKAKAKKKA